MEFRNNKLTNNTCPSWVTNITKDRIEVYQKIIAEIGDDYGLYILAHAVDDQGRVLNDCSSLWANETKDLSPFWNRFRELENNIK